MPESASTALFITGFWAVDVKLLGPLHDQVIPVLASLPNKYSLPPLHAVTAVVVTVGDAGGAGFDITTGPALADVHAPPMVTFTLS
jgi:hypothetical protein